LQAQLLGWRLQSEPAVEIMTIMDTVLRGHSAACDDDHFEELEKAYEQHQEPMHEQVN
jgi:hypothetical protein